jgi:DNA-binding LacI/PurR family transcriptional regulator
MAAITAGKRRLLSDKLAQTLRQRVRTGQYQSGSSLPPVRKLSQEFGVSLNVVQRAVRNLEQEGILSAHHGRSIMVQTEDPCQRTAIFFGIIQPYLSSMGFHRDVLEYVDGAFAERSNFAVVRSSKDDPAREREIAEHLIANGVSGLIVWPTCNDPNGAYFQDLAQRIPVVLVDRLLAGADLPTVVLDYHACGCEIVETLFGEQKRKRLLALMDNLQISSYQEIVSGMEMAAWRAKRAKDLTIVQFPLSALLKGFYREDYSQVTEYTERVRRLLTDGGYDAVFCTQDEFIDYGMAQTELMDDFPGVRLATLRNSAPNDRSMKYSQLNCLEWRTNSGQMLSHAADLVQTWALSRRMPKEKKSLPLQFDQRKPE